MLNVARFSVAFVHFGKLRLLPIFEAHNSKTNIAFVVHNFTINLLHVKSDRKLIHKPQNSHEVDWNAKLDESNAKCMI